MERRTYPTCAATPVADAIKDAGANASIVSEATGISLSDLNERLTDESTFTVSELGKVGGFLHVRPSRLMSVAA